MNLPNLSLPVANSSKPVAKLQPHPPWQASPFRRSEEHTSELQSQSNLVCRLLLEKKKKHLKNSRFLFCSFVLYRNDRNLYLPLQALVSNNTPFSSNMCQHAHAAISRSSWQDSTCA